MELRVDRQNIRATLRDVQMASGRTLSLILKDMLNIKLVAGNVADYYRNIRDWVLAQAKAYTDSQVGTAVASANAASHAAANAAEQVNIMSAKIAEVEAMEEDIQEATDAANEAAAAAEQAVEDVQEAIESQSLGFPTSMTVEYPARLTYGNKEDVKIKAVLYPTATALQNIIYLADNKAVSVYPDGSIHINEVGRSIVHVIPTMKTSIAKTLLISVEAPAMRIVDKTHIRLLGNGNIRLS